MTSMTRKQLARQALEKSLEVREEYRYDFRSPLCVYELADRAGVKVQFVNDVSMEGFYAALAKPTVLLSSLRPLPRRAFTCAHELGHHFFGHGSTIDELQDDVEGRTFSPNEFLADTFAGFILMPAQAVKRAFSTRGLAAPTATPEQIYQVASSFGVGYQTIIGHLEYSLRYITTPNANVPPQVEAPADPGTDSGLSDEVPPGHRRPVPRARNARRRGRYVGPSAVGCRRGLRPHRTVQEHLQRHSFQSHASGARSRLPVQRRLGSGRPCFARGLRRPCQVPPSRGDRR